MLERSILHEPRKGKTIEINQAWTHTFLNLRHNSKHIDAVTSGTGRRQENRIFGFLKSLLSKSKFFSQMFIAWNVGQDRKIKNLDDMGTLRNELRHKVHSSKSQEWGPVRGVFMSPVWISNFSMSRFRKVHACRCRNFVQSHWYRYQRCLTMECLT